MYYIKCGVNSSLLTSFWLLQVCGTLHRCFSTIHSIHKEGDILQIYFCVMSRETGHHAQAHVTSATLVHTVPLLWPREHRRQKSGFILLAIVSSGCFCWGWLLLLPLNRLLTKLAFAPYSQAASSTRISLMASSSSFVYFYRPLLETHNRLPCLDYYVWRDSLKTQYQWDMDVFYSDSTTDLRLRYDCCINVPAIRGCPGHC